MKDTNEMLAMTMLGLRSTDFKSGYYPCDNGSIDAPEFVPTGATYSSDKMDSVVSTRVGYQFN